MTRYQYVDRDSDFISLVVMPFVFWAVQKSTIQHLTGWWAIRFFQLHKMASDCALRPPTSECNNACEEEPCIMIPVYTMIPLCPERVGCLTVYRRLLQSAVRELLRAVSRRPATERPNKLALQINGLCFSPLNSVCTRYNVILTLTVLPLKMFVPSAYVAM